ncbi:hypothetical protein Pdw03_8502 [Penicillium digitatum]|uniref:Uncharacterized protein n=1 Tax=Penicillium digitatum TaxID=36651 RepID=A0A7T7BM47_PENDI|nr:hypothetical protein Pdw03_8502 [Penicillium digitatum]
MLIPQNISTNLETSRDRAEPLGRSCSIQLTKLQQTRKQTAHQSPHLISRVQRIRAFDLFGPLGANVPWCDYCTVGLVKLPPPFTPTKAIETSIKNVNGFWGVLSLSPKLHPRWPRHIPVGLGPDAIPANQSAARSSHTRLHRVHRFNPSRYHRPAGRSPDVREQAPL